MRFLVVLFLAVACLYAEILKPFYLYKAQQESARQQYGASLQNYRKISDKNDKIYYNMGNIFYRQGSYYEALQAYKRIVLPQMQAKKFYNMANCYVKLGELSKAVFYYTKSLHFQKDQDTLFNLHSVQKALRKLHKLKHPKEIHTTAQIHAGKNKTEKIDKHSLAKPKDVGTKKHTRLVSKGEAKGTQIDKEKVTDFLTSARVKLEDRSPMSDLEERKWDEILHHKGLKTLLIPLGGSTHDTQNNSW